MSKSLWLSSRNHQPSPCAAVAVWWCCVISRSLESLLHYSCPVHNMSAARMHKRVCTPLTQTRSRKHFPRKTQKNSFCVERNRSKTNFYCYLSSYSFFSVFYLKDENCIRLTRTRAEGQVILRRFYPLSALPSIPPTHPPNLLLFYLPLLPKVPLLRCALCSSSKVLPIGVSFFNI